MESERFTVSLFFKENDCYYEKRRFNEHKTVHCTSVKNALYNRSLKNLKEGFLHVY